MSKKSEHEKIKEIINQIATPIPGLERYIKEQGLDSSIEDTLYGMVRDHLFKTQLYVEKIVVKELGAFSEKLGRRIEKLDNSESRLEDLVRDYDRRFFIERRDLRNCLDSYFDEF